jgi:hypothetical protein
LFLLSAINRHSPSIFCAEVFDKVKLDEYPTFAWLRSGYFTGLRFAQQRYGMDVQKRRRFS